MVRDKPEKRRHESRADVCTSHLYADYALRIFRAEVRGRGVDDAGVNGRAAQPDDDKARHRANADGQRCKHNSEERKPRARTYHAVVAQLIGNKARYEAPRRYADEK